MSTPLYILAGLALVAFAVVVFRIAVRNAYRRAGRLNAWQATLEAAVFTLWGCFTWADMPGGWPVLFTHVWTRVVGWSTVGLGLGSWFLVFFYLGVRRSFGQMVDGLRQAGPYRVSRNPQVLVVGLAVAGYCLIRPTWHTLGWLALYAAISHLMVLTEEEHLVSVFGEAYVRYASLVPRYLRVLPHRPRSAA